MYKRHRFIFECLYSVLNPHRNLEYLFLSDLPGISDKQTTVDRLQTALPRLEIALDLE